MLWFTVLAGLTMADTAIADNIHRVGMLEMTSAAANAKNLNALTDGMRELGYEVGRNLVIYYRSAEGDPRRFPALAADLRSAGVDLIVARTIVAAASALKAAPGTPIVMPGSGDPVAFGLAKSLARPGGSVTGLTAATPPVSSTRLQLIKEAFPSIRRVGTLIEPTAPPPKRKVAEQTPPSIGLSMNLLRVRTADDLAAAFQASMRRRDEALLVGAGTILQGNIPRIVDFAAKQRLPAVYALPEFVEAGGLMAYSVSIPHLYRRAATYVDRIFKGARPGDLPIERPTRFQLTVNVRTAEALQLALPDSLLARADHIID